MLPVGQLVQLTWQNYAHIVRLIITINSRKDFGFFHWQGGASLLKAPNHTHTQNRPNTHNAACGPTGEVDVAKFIAHIVRLIDTINSPEGFWFLSLARRGEPTKSPKPHSYTKPPKHT